MFLYYKVPQGVLKKNFFSKKNIDVTEFDLQSRFQHYTKLPRDFGSTRTLLRHPLFYIHKPNMDVR